MASSRSTKDKEMASHLKKKGVQRTTGQCPRGCGHNYRLDGKGGALMAHLGVCMGSPRKVHNR